MPDRPAPEAVIHAAAAALARDLGVPRWRLELLKVADDGGPGFFVVGVRLEFLDGLAIDGPAIEKPAPPAAVRARLRSTAG
jgi:hypothetical protein